ncbi:MAG: D-alanyl-D-alanine carboxypeptidase [Candidatus Pacebacteria bacterium]|nr:D-alanyl-D-alanine carboxypeptidase [Candidatus Paceibacterota bacterium]
MQNPETIKTYNNALAFSLLSVAIAGTFFFVGNNKLNEEYKQQEEKYEKIQATLNSTEFVAKAISVYDITDSRKIYSKNDEVVLPIASIAKIMTVVEGLKGRNPEDIIYVSSDAVKQAGDFGMLANEKWKIGELAKATLVVSANDGAYALSELGDNFLNNINSKVRRLGAANTIFANSTGLDIYNESKEEVIGVGVVATAEDVNAMAAHGLKAYPEIFSATTLAEINIKSESGFEHNFKNTNTLIGKIPNLLFSKTGFTETAGGSLVIIFKDKNGHDIAVTVLGSTYDGRFEDMEKIVNVLYNN